MEIVVFPAFARGLLNWSCLLLGSSLFLRPGRRLNGNRVILVRVEVTLEACNLDDAAFVVLIIRHVGYSDSWFHFSADANLLRGLLLLDAGGASAVGFGPNIARHFELRVAQEVVDLARADLVQTNDSLLVLRRAFLNADVAILNVEHRLTLCANHVFI